MPAQTSPGQPVGTELDYVEVTTGTTTVTATSNATAQAYLDGNSVTYDGVLRIRIAIYIAQVDITSSQSILVDLYEDSTDLGQIYAVGILGNTAFSTCYVERFRTPSAGAHVYHGKLWKTGGTAHAYAGAGGAGGVYLPAFLRVTVA